ncbi:MAG: acyl--CoA ligase [Chloroflexi bacterium]|nr:acyl--CoA ligase [Chloroflexota bacterium]
MKPTRFTSEMVDEYVSKKYWDGGDTVTELHEVVALFGAKEAVVDSRGRSMTWKELDHCSDMVALGLLNDGLKRDDVVLVQPPNIVDSTVVRLGLQKAGLVGVYIPSTLRGELHAIIAKLEPAAFVGLPSNVENVRSKGRGKTIRYLLTVGDDKVSDCKSVDELIQHASEGYTTGDERVKKAVSESRINPFDVSFILSTSGSTGAPKFCEWPEQAVRLYARTVAERLRLSSQDTLGLFAPLSGGVGVTLWLAAVLTGAKSVLLERFDPSTALSMVEKHRVTVAGVVPTQAIRMAKAKAIHSFDIGSLRAVRVGGAKIGYETAVEVQNKLGCRIVCVAGIADAMAIGHTSIDDPEEVRLGTVGKPWLHNEVRIVDKNEVDAGTGDEGEVWVRGPCTASGYFKDVGLTEKAWGVMGIDGWCRTGDIGRFDADGNITLIGRTKDIIIRGGQNIYPGEIEAILSSHPKVIDVVVIPMPDDELGERACACVLPKEGEELSYSEMFSFLEEKELALYKFPERLIVVDAIPTVSDGSKIDRFALKAKVERRLSNYNDWRSSVKITLQRDVI